MASLWATIQKKGSVSINQLIPERFGDVWLESLTNDPPTLVNIGPIWTAFMAPGYAGGPEDLTPPRKSLWLEWLVDFPDFRRREAAWITRQKANVARYPAAHQTVDAVFFVEHEDRVALMDSLSVDIDKLGRVCPADQCYRLDCLGETDGSPFVGRLAVIGEALSIMNTKGTRIDPPLDHHVQVVKPKRPPCSVWHTIHVPRFQGPPLGVESSPEILERREHWVRAHRRDYRQGGGMFGRTKAMIWVPEFQRGNPELGTVKQSYQVAPLRGRE